MTGHRPPRLALLALALLLPGLGGCRPERPPNVLLVVLDTARADAVSAYGAAGAATPVLDRLAAEGVLYTRARSTGAWTVPAHGSMFTGLYPSRHGAHHEHLRLDPSLTTLAELLAPTHVTAGFSENPHIGPARGFDQGFEHFEETWRGQRSAADIAPTPLRVLAWLARRERDRPFFVFVNYMAPHLPYAPPPSLAEAFLPAGAEPEIVDWLRGLDEWAARLYISGDDIFADGDVELLTALYRAEVAFADARLGLLLDALAAEGELDHTLVVVVGDHGENLTDHGLMEHQFCLYDTLLRVPLVLRLPGTVPAGEVSAAPVQLVDLVPTVLEAVGVERRRWPAVEGTSLLSAPPAADRPQVAEYMRPEAQRWRFKRIAPEFDFDRLDRRLKAVVIGETKLIAAEDGSLELYDLAADPGERHNLAAEQPELAARLAHWLETFAAGATTPRPAGDEPELDEETRDALRALGYLD